jgi:ABC-type multidrug transport system fused ATPase/permease subunit
MGLTHAGCVKRPKRDAANFDRKFSKALASYHLWHLFSADSEYLYIHILSQLSSLFFINFVTVFYLPLYIFSLFMAPTSPSALHEGEGTGGSLWRTLSRTFSRGNANEPMSSDEDQDEPISKAENWKHMPAVKEAKANDAAVGRRLGVTWKDLTIQGIASDMMLHENALSQFNIPKLAKESRQPKHMKTIVDSSFGCVKPGEMLLVLGRPGSGCTSLLKVLANRRKGFVGRILPPWLDLTLILRLGMRTFLETLILGHWMLSKPKNTVVRLL